MQAKWLVAFPALVLVLSGVSWGQNPTFSLIPLVGDVGRQCIGGPKHGFTCSSTADCDTGPKCQRQCDGGERDGESCSLTSGCPGGLCPQRCACEYVVKAGPGDTIITEIWASNFPADTIGWQVVVDFRAITCDILPVGWNAPSPLLNCMSDTDCPGAIPVCFEQSYCAGSDHDPSLGAFIDLTRTDYIFSGMSLQTDVDTSTLRYRFAGIRWNGPVLNPQEPAYCGTLVLRAQSGLSSGSAKIAIKGQPESTFNGTGNKQSPTLDKEELTVGSAIIGDPIVVHADPRNDSSLTRPEGNVIRLSFFGSVPFDAVDHMEIRELLDNGRFGAADLSAFFLYTIEPPVTLKIEEPGTVFTQGQWYGVLYDGWKVVDYRALVGDANNSGFTNFADLAAIRRHFADPTYDGDRYDINASGFVNFADLAAAFSASDSFSPPKPFGHSCILP